MSNNVHVLQLSSYTTPIIKESKRDNWVDFGEDNDYYSFLIDRYTNSTTNNAIVNSISRLIYGRGLSAVDASRKPNEYAQMMALFNPDCLRKVAFDRKMLGQFALQIHYNDKHDKILKAYHIPVNLLRSEKCNEDGEILGYYYSDNWEDVKKFPPKRFASFGTSKDKVEILFSKPYAVGMKYYAYPDYQGAIPYCVLEEEVSQYLISDCQTGFSGTKIVNFNNGVPTEEQQSIISNKVLSKLTGSKGQKVIVAFNDSVESKTTVEDIPLNDAPDHYAYLSEECVRKIMLGHSVTSPLIFGISSASGFSSNADELENSFILFNNMVIKPLQDELIDALDKILAYNEVSLKLFFKTLKPLEFTDLENASTDEQVSEETGTNLSAQSESEVEDFDDDEMLNSLDGEIVDLEEWELVDAREVDEENENIEDWANGLIKEKKTTLQKLSGFIKSKPNGFSYLDKSFYKVRYSYNEKYSSGNSRMFCKKMMTRTSSGVVYRLEDIDAASRSGVNKSFGHKGQSYDLFKYKGGSQCGHYWKEELYRMKSKTEKYISKGTETNSIPSTYKPTPRGNAESKIAPKDMPNNGRHPNSVN